MNQDGTTQDARIVPFPRGHEAPAANDVDIDGQEVSIIYLPWSHQVDGETRPAGLYYRAPDSAGFYATPTTDDVDGLLEEMLPELKRHLRLVSAREESELTLP